MNAKCAYHPDRPAAAACRDCAAPLCADCQTRIDGRTVCPRCADIARAGVAAPSAQVTGAPAASAAPQTSAPGFSGPATVTIPPPSAAAESTATPVPIPSPIVKEPPPPARILVGIALAAVVGLVGAFLWEKIYFHLHFSMAWFYIILGLFIGGCVVGGGGRYGIIPALLGGALTFGAIMFGHWLLMHDVLAKELAEFNAELAKAVAAKGAHAPTVVSAPHVTSEMFKEFLADNFDAKHWIFVGIGVLVGFYVPLKQRQSASVR